MTGERRAEADQITAAQLIERSQQMMLIGEPALVPGDDRCSVAMRTDAKGIAPFAATTDVDGSGGHAHLLPFQTLQIASFPNPVAEIVARMRRDGVGHGSRKANRERLAR